MNNKINNLLIPNVSKLPTHQRIDKTTELPVSAEEFKGQLRAQMEEVEKQHGIQLSLHAAKRLTERNLQIDSDEYLKLKEAMEKLKDKGGKDSLVITSKAAYILDVDQNKIVTAIDRESIGENIFTKIDSTVVMS